MDRATKLAIPEISSTYEYKPVVSTGWPDSAVAPILCTSQGADRGGRAPVAGVRPRPVAGRGKDQDQACALIESASVFTSVSMCDFSTMYGGAITSTSPAGRTSAPLWKQSRKMS